jgi:hypothetical protein
MPYLSATGIIGSGMKEIERSCKMKKFRLLSLLILISATILTSATVFGAGGNSFKYKESYKQKLQYSSYYDYYDVFDYGKFNISAKLLLEGKNIDLSQIDGNTEFYFEVGDVYTDVILADGIYRPGKKGSGKASFVLSDYDYVTDRNNVPYMWINLSWNSKTLTVKIKGLTGTPDIVLPIIAYDYLYEDPGSYDDDLSGDLIFGGAEWAFDVPCTINVKQKTKKDKYKSPWDLWFINSKGNGYEIPVE